MTSGEQPPRASETSATKARPPSAENKPRPPLPIITPESAPFWRSADERCLRLQRCDDCAKFFYPPSTFCPKCWSTSLSWGPIAGTGTVFSFVVYRRLWHRAFSDLMPYAVAVIELSEGPRFVSRLTNVDVETIVCGMPVRITYEEVTDGVTLPLFEPS